MKRLSFTKINKQKNPFLINQKKTEDSNRSEKRDTINNDGIEIIIISAQKYKG